MPRCKGICTCCCSGAGPYVSFNMGTIWRSAAKKRLREHAQGSPPGTANQIAACQHGVEKSHGTHASSLCLRISKSPCYSLRLLPRSASTQAKRQCVTSLAAVFTCDRRVKISHGMTSSPMLLQMLALLTLVAMWFSHASESDVTSHNSSLLLKI